MLKSFSDLIGNWPREVGRTSIGTFAIDIAVPYQHAATMKQRNSIAPDFWPRVLRAAAGRGVALSHEQLLRMRETSRRREAKRRKANELLREEQDGDGRKPAKQRTQASAA